MKSLRLLLFLLAIASLSSAQTYTYDNANRLTQASYSNGLTISYSYDKLGNRIGQQITAGTLPIAINYFSASSEKCDVQVVWRAGNQDDLVGYELERSRDGNSFVSIAMVLVTRENNYQYEDKASAGKGYQYYRLKLNNVDGSYIYSQVLSVFTDCLNPAQLHVYPNPATETVRVKFTAKETGTYNLALYDVQGRLLSSKDIEVNTQRNEFSYPLTGLAPAIYYLKLTYGREVIGVEKIEKR